MLRNSPEEVCDITEVIACLETTPSSTSEVTLKAEQLWGAVRHFQDWERRIGESMASNKELKI